MITRVWLVYGLLQNSPAPGVSFSHVQWVLG